MVRLTHPSVALAARATDESRRRSTADTDTSRPTKLLDAAYFKIERMIVSGELAPGAWVTETDLVEQSGFSRAPVRSAVSRLADQQLMTVHPRRGAQVCEVNYTQQFRALELRRVVERLLVRSAANRADQSQRRQFAALAEEFGEMAHLPDQSRMTDLDSRQFSLLLLAADNVFAAKAMTSVKGLSRRFWILNQARHGDSVRMAQAQAAIAHTLAIGSPEQAEQAVDALIDYVEAFTMKVVGYSPPER